MVTLAELSAGDTAIIKGFHQGAKAYRGRLLALGLLPGTQIEVERIAPLGDPVEVSVRGSSLSLRKDEASLLELERVL